MAMRKEEFLKHDISLSPTAKIIIECMAEARRKEGLYSLRAMEVAARTRLSKLVVGGLLNRMKKLGIVRHKRPEWALDDKYYEKYIREHGGEYAEVGDGGETDGGEAGKG